MTFVSPADHWGMRTQVTEGGLASHPPSVRGDRGVNVEQFQTGVAPFEEELRQFLLKHCDLPPAEIHQLEPPRRLVYRRKK